MQQINSNRPKILYVCPLAHRGGHRPSAVLSETKALSFIGLDVTLLTFNGFIGDEQHLEIPHIKLLSAGWYAKFVNSLDKILNSTSFTQNFAILFEQSTTILKAISLKKNMEYPLIYLRDGDPFLLPVFFINLPFKGNNWIIHMILDPRHGILQKFSYANLWSPIYKCCLRRNCFILICENELIKHEFELVLRHTLRQHVMHVTLLGNYSGTSIKKEEARNLLKLPKDKILFLSFGSLHIGKNIHVVAEALKSLQNVNLVIAGKASPDIIKEVKSVNKNVIIRNYYIPETEKALYYAAVDCIILSYNKEFLERQSSAMLWDACKFGIPIIASDGGELGYITKKFQVGLTFAPENSVSLHDAVQQFLNLKKEDLNTLNMNCQLFCKEFSEEKWARTIKKTYQYMQRIR